MNLLLLSNEELLSPEHARLLGERADGAARLYRLEVGSRVRVGVVGGLLGRGRVAQVSPGLLELEVSLSDAPPARMPCILIVGLSRPQTIKKVVQAAVTSGVEELHFVRSERGEKSYSSSTILTPEALSAEIALGLAQAVDTVAPLIEVHQRFLPCVEDVIPSRLQQRAEGPAWKVVADTGSHKALQPFCSAVPERALRVFAVGSEAGWSEHELSVFKAQGFQSVSLGPRVLRVETAVAMLLGVSLASGVSA